MKRLFTLLVVLGLVGFVAFKAAVWWLADQRLDEARTALESSGVLERGTISSGVDGRLVLSGNSWQDFRLTRSLEIGRVELDAGSPVDLIMALMDPASLPASWSLQAEGVGLVLEATMFRNWVTAEGENSAGEPALFVLSCAPDPRQRLGSGDLMRMGITGLGGEVLLQQRPDSLYAELNTAGTGSLELDWPGARLNLLEPEDLVDSSTEPMTVTLRDGGLMRRVAAYCAREAGLEPPEWAGRVLSAFREGLEARGLVASDQLLALYRQWLLEGGELTATLEPGGVALGIPISPAGEEDDGNDWQVAYNGARVPDVFLREAALVAEEPNEAASGSDVPEENPDVQGWYADSIENAGRWIDRKVRVTLSNDNVVEGRLVSVSDRELEVARVVAGGEVAYPMLVRAITDFEVWRRGRKQ
ncbi:acetylornithine deacetylase [Marinobacter sp. F4206]|uniref:acetylornithine deacetylase n=1 Tax=Marinobacter sp. F4206 TaxID=2861777 RepID=UPI001C5FAD8E|nr:acetylornithine deacetylase [Marinobacter sp. F4206]MBW4934660.1 acetylornithine deacetylase [Marinobacter sp. F4206]